MNAFENDLQGRLGMWDKWIWDWQLSVEKGKKETKKTCKFGIRKWVNIHKCQYAIVKPGRESIPFHRNVEGWEPGVMNIASI
jgi:hypothetical protein